MEAVIEDECDHLPDDGNITQAGIFAGGTIIDWLHLGRARVLGLGTINSNCFSKLNVYRNWSSVYRNRQLTGKDQQEAEGLPEKEPAQWPSVEGSSVGYMSGVVPNVSGAEAETADPAPSGESSHWTAKERAALKNRRASVNTQRKRFSTSHADSVESKDEVIYNPPDIVASAQNSCDVDHAKSPDVAQISQNYFTGRHVSFSPAFAGNSDQSQDSSRRHSSAQERRSDFKESGYGGSSGGISLETSQEEDTDDVFSDQQKDAESSSLQYMSMDHVQCDSLANYSSDESSTNSFLSTKPGSSERNMHLRVPLVEPQKETPGTGRQFDQYGDHCSDCHGGGIIPDWHGLGLSSPLSCSGHSCSHNMQLGMGANGGGDLGITEADVHIHRLQCPVSLRFSLSNCSERACKGKQMDWSIGVACTSSARSAALSCHCSLASIQENDISYKSDSQIEAMRRRYLLRLRDQVYKDMLNQGASPEEILAVTHPLWSESDGSGSPSDTISSISLESGLACGRLGVVSSSQASSGPKAKSSLTFNIISHQSSFVLQPLEANSQQGFVVENLCGSAIVEKLKMSHCCHYPGCQDTDCVMGRVLEQIIIEYMNKGLIYISHHGTVVLSAIAEHAEDCDVELKCPIPWCSFFHYHDMPFSEQMTRLQQAYFSGLVTLNLELEPTDKFQQLDPGLVNEYQEGVHWTALSRLGNFSNAVLAVTSNTEHPAYWVVKKVSRTHTMEMHVNVLKQVARQRHPRITRYLWLLEQKTCLYVAAMFEGGSLGDRMNEKGANSGLPPRAVVRYLNQLTSAVAFLHRLRVAYLNWTVDNIIVNSTGTFVKLCNFSSAVLMDSPSLDEEYDLPLLLPPRIIPPEIYDGGPVVAKSDIWGLGCLCYHMTTGHMIRPEWRHLDPALVREQLSELTDQVPDISAIQDDMIKDIISICLQVIHRHRPSAADLRLRHLIPN